MAPSSLLHRQAPAALHHAAFKGCQYRPRMAMKVYAKAAQTSSVIREIQQQVASKQRSAVEVTSAYLARLRSVEGQVHSFLTVNEEQALEQAKALDERIAREGAAAVGPLAGVPVAIKDNICTQGVRTTAGSRILDSYVPPFNATAAERLAHAGAVLLGKTNMDEFGMGSSTENSAYKSTRNPWDTECVPGGSSGGSAAAVAAGQCAAALGSDTGGSIRQPAHFCGVVGLKPTYGRVSRHGLIAYASSLDVIGPLAPTVEDAALILNAVAGSDQFDSTCASEPVPDFTAGLVSPEQLSSKPLTGRRFGLISETLGEGVSAGVSAAVRQAVAHLESLGAVVEEVSLPTFDAGLPAYYVLATSEASSNLARYDGVRYGLRYGVGSSAAANGNGATAHASSSNGSHGRVSAEAAVQDLKAMYDGTRGEGLGVEVKRRILMGTYALSAGYYDAYYKRAQQVRTLVQQEMQGALSKYDALLSPTAPTPAYRLGEKTSDPLEMYKGDLMTVNLNLSGLPAIVVPCGLAGGSGGSSPLPVGLQFVGRAFQEGDLCAIAHVFERTASALVDATPAVWAGRGQ